MSRSRNHDKKRLSFFLDEAGFYDEVCSQFDRAAITGDCVRHYEWRPAGSNVRVLSREEPRELYPSKRLLCGQEWPLQKCEREAR